MNTHNFHNFRTFKDKNFTNFFLYVKKYNNPLFFAYLYEKRIVFNSFPIVFTADFCLFTPLLHHFIFLQIIPRFQTHFLQGDTIRCTSGGITGNKEKSVILQDLFFQADYLLFLFSVLLSSVVSFVSQQLLFLPVFSYVFFVISISSVIPF